MDYPCKLCSEERVLKAKAICAKCKQTSKWITEAHGRKGDRYQKPEHRTEQKDQ